MHKIWFNGKGYPDAEAMPPEVRRRYEEALNRKSAVGGEASSDGVRVGVWDDGRNGTFEVHTSREIIVNGKKYSDLDQLPPEERKLVQKMMDEFPNLDDRFGGMEILEDFESRATGLEGLRGELGADEIVLRSSRMTEAPGGQRVRRSVSPWNNGWAVAFVLALALLWVLVFKG